MYYLCTWCSVRADSFYLSFVIVSNTTGMPHLKIINASRGPIHEYGNLKTKLYNCNSNIYFNQQCHRGEKKTNYSKMKTPNASTAARFTQRKTHHLRVKDEIKYLYIKKQQPNRQLCHLHLSLRQLLSLHPVSK
jgi:hypothetical protein